MQQIQKLPESLINQIAAGEVVESPFSVVKELVENSIDAAASKIMISVKNGGRDFIQVLDDGKGMSEADCRLSVERHATSKIKEVADLYSIQSMGFRRSNSRYCICCRIRNLRVKLKKWDLIPV